MSCRDDIHLSHYGGLPGRAVLLLKYHPSILYTSDSGRAPSPDAAGSWIWLPRNYADRR